MYIIKNYKNRFSKEEIHITMAEGPQAPHPQPEKTYYFFQ